MKTSRRTSRRRSVATALAAVVAVSGISLTSTLTLAEEATEPDSPAAREANDGAGDVEQQAQSGISASMYFTDEFGNRREPTAQEIRQAAEAFQRDLTRLAGQHKDKPNVRSRPDGTVSATVAVSKLAFLTVQETDEGELIYGHSSMDEDGNVTFTTPTVLPEK
jgi:hypothetical protein